MPDELSQLANAAIALCAVMVVFHLVRSRKRGWRSLWMAGAFAAFGGLVQTLSAGSPSWIALALGGILAVCLVGDVLARLGPAAPKAEGP